jgi:hypothetical protein
MMGACIDCANLGTHPVADFLNAYVCNAERLPDPEGRYLALPSRTSGDFRFGQRERPDVVQRCLARGPVEGKAIVLFGPDAGKLIDREYHWSPCPAWHFRTPWPMRRAGNEPTD